MNICYIDILKKMVIYYIHKIRYVIKFKETVDYFDVVLQKQIDTRFKCADCSTREINVIRFELSEDKRLCDSEYMKKYSTLFANYNIRYKFLELNNSPDKYNVIKYIYKIVECYDIRLLKYYKLEKMEDGIGMGVIMSYEEFEYYFETMLEEFHLFLNTWEFEDGEKKFIDSIVMDEKLKPNIEFAGWIDEWITC
jgi:hypothetical protein